MTCNAEGFLVRTKYNYTVNLKKITNMKKKYHRQNATSWNAKKA